MVETGYTGYLCRVLKEGTVQKDSEITLIEQHPARISILTANDIYFQRIKDSARIESLLNVEVLAEAWRDSLAKQYK